MSTILHKQHTPINSPDDVRHSQFPRSSGLSLDEFQPHNEFHFHERANRGDRFVVWATILLGLIAAWLA